MPGNSFGTLFRITTAGESHGPGNVVIIDGVPAGLPLHEDDLRPDLARRRPGQSPLVTQRQEVDEPEILSGVFDGLTTGTSIAVLIRNTDRAAATIQRFATSTVPGMLTTRLMLDMASAITVAVAAAVHARRQRGSQQVQSRRN